MPTELEAINDAGWIVGSYVDANNVSHCLLYKPPYDAPYGFGSFSSNGGCTSINGFGQILSLDIPARTSSLTFYDAEAAAPSNFAVINQAFGSVLAWSYINNNGQIAGAAYDPSTWIFGGYFLSADWTSYLSLPISGASDTYIAGFNDDVQMAGYAYVDSSSLIYEGFTLDTPH